MGTSNSGISDYISNIGSSTIGSSNIGSSTIGSSNIGSSNLGCWSLSLMSDIHHGQILFSVARNYSAANICIVFPPVREGDLTFAVGGRHVEINGDVQQKNGSVTAAKRN
jgi:hypothetical protein